VQQVHSQRGPDSGPKGTASSAAQVVGQRPGIAKVAQEPLSTNAQRVPSVGVPAADGLIQRDGAKHGIDASNGSTKSSWNVDKRASDEAARARSPLLGALASSQGDLSTLRTASEVHAASRWADALGDQDCTAGSWAERWRCRMRVPQPICAFDRSRDACVDASAGVADLLHDMPFD